MLLLAMCGAGDLAHTVAVARFCLLLSFPMLLLAVCGAGDLAHAVSVARFCLLLSFPMLLMAVCGAGDLAHTVSVARFCLLLSSSLLLKAVCGAGALAHTVSVARVCLLLSSSLLLMAVCGAGDLAHTVSVAHFCLLLSSSLLLLAACGACDLAHTVSMALFLNYTFFPFSSSGHWLVMCASAAVVLLSLVISAINYPPMTLLQEDIHGFRNIMLLAIGTFYLLSYRTVGLRFDGNPCPYLLSPTAPAPRTRCLGQSVARFAILFEALFGAFLEPFWSRLRVKSCIISSLLSLDHWDVFPQLPRFKQLLAH